MKKQKKGCILCLLLICSAILTSCLNPSEKGENNKLEDSHQEDVISPLIYYTIGTPDKDLKKVNDMLNIFLMERYKIYLDYRKIGWREYGVRLSNMINSGSSFDVVFASGQSQGGYAENAKKGIWLPLDDFLANEGKEIYDSLSPLFWEGAKIDGSIYGIPTNKEVAVPEHWIFPKELVDKYDLDIYQLTSFEALKPVFAMIKEKEPSYEIMQLDSASHNFFAIDGYEYLLEKEIPIMVKSDDDELTVVNIFETKDARKTLETLEEFYNLGYINKDAAFRESGDFPRGKKLFWNQGSGGPYSETIWSNDRGYEVVAVPVTKSIVTTESARGALMCINALTKNKESAYAFLLAVNTDSDIRNMLNYGLEEIHYVYDENDQVKIISEDYQGVQYTQGNFFILETRSGEPLDKWEKYKEFNDSAIASKALGFSADTSMLTEQLRAVENVWKRYYAGLMTGSADVSTALPKFNAALKEAGIDIIIDEIQRQIDVWRMQAK